MIGALERTRKARRGKKKRIRHSPIALYVPAPFEITEQPQLAPTTWQALPGTEPVLLHEYKAGCRWPIGEDLPFRYCAAPIRAESSYCETHHRMAYHPLPPKKTNAEKTKDQARKN